jgi:hypothetical protein
MEDVGLLMPVEDLKTVILATQITLITNDPKE